MRQPRLEKDALYNVRVPQLAVLELRFLQIPPRDGHPCAYLTVRITTSRSGLSPYSYLSCLAHLWRTGQFCVDITINERNN